MAKNDSDIDERWANYRFANTRFSSVRRIELAKQLEYTTPEQGERILEIGTGNGILSFALAEAVGKNGSIVTYDYRQDNLNYTSARNSNDLPLRFEKQNSDYDFRKERNLFDRVSTIATFHHYDDCSRESGLEGRQKVLTEIYGILKEGGKLIIGDVADNTDAQRYFDGPIDNPESIAFCHPVGHPHDFFDQETATRLCKNAGFKNIEYVIEQTPWEFDSEEQAGEFLRTLHNAKCTPKESLEEAKNHLSFWECDGKFYLGWELFYLVAEK